MSSQYHSIIKNIVAKEKRLLTTTEFYKIYAEAIDHKFLDLDFPVSDDDRKLMKIKLSHQLQPSLTKLKEQIDSEFNKMKVGEKVDLRKHWKLAYDPITCNQCNRIMQDDHKSKHDCS